MSRRKNNRGVQRFNIEPVGNIGSEHFMGGGVSNIKTDDNMLYTEDDLDWSTCPQRGRTRDSFDFSLTTVKNGDQYALNFIFRKDTFIKENCGKYMVPVLSKNKKRMYFVDDPNGFKCGKGGKQNNLYMRVKYDEIFLPFVGNYALKKEPLVRWFFIEIDEKKEN